MGGERLLEHFTDIRMFVGSGKRTLTQGLLHAVTFNRRPDCQRSRLGRIEYNG
jgi:hypothetical protein